jgi:hypothetical protein
MSGPIGILLLALCISASYGDYYPTKAPVKEETPFIPVLENRPLDSFNNNNFVILTTTQAPQAPQAPQYPQKHEEPILRHEEPVVSVPSTQFRTLCGENQSGKSMFYVAHPENRKWFLQCDENGKVFLKFCPEDTVFTDNLVCEGLTGKEEKPIAIQQQETTVLAVKPIVIDITPMMPLAQVVAHDSSYPVAPLSPLSSFSPSSSLPSSASPLFPREAPEFRAQCELQRSISRVAFYLPHPIDRSLFIQCDEFGNAFVHSCPQDLFFTASFTCRREGEDAESTIEVRPPQPPIMSGPTLSTYQSGSISSTILLTSADLTGTVESSQEAPEFADACRNKIQSGVLVFYIKHTSDESKYIQCDEFGKAFLKQCPSGLVFSERLGCARKEQIEQAVVETSQELKKPISLDAGLIVGNADLGLAESLEFKHLCVSNPTGSSGSIFFLPHPSDKMLYIQCDEFGRAFVRQCQFGTLFVAESRACEKETEMRPVVFMQPIRGETIVNLDSYPTATTTRLPEPVVIAIEAYPTTPIILLEEPKTTQSYPAQPIVFAEEITTTQAYPTMPLTTPVIVFEEPPRTTQAPIVVTTQASYPARSEIVLEEIKTTTQAPIVFTPHIRGRPVLKHNGY